VIVDRSTFSGNWTDGLQSIGGAMAVSDYTTLINSTISGNATLGAESAGGGLSVSYTAYAFDITHSSIVDNTSVSGADGIYTQNPSQLVANITNTLIAQSEAGDTACNVAFGDPASIGNLVTDTSCGTASLVGGAPIGFVTLALGPLADNGGPTQTHALLDGSAAIDAADTDACSAALVNGVDQRGTARPADGVPLCDVGAYEKTADEIFADGFDGAPR